MKSIEEDDVIVCPFCEYWHGNYDDYIEVGNMSGEFEMDCEKCGENFKVDFFSVFHFTTTKP